MLIKHIAYLIKPCRITNLVGWWYTCNRMMEKLMVLREKLMFQQLFLTLVPIVWFVAIQTRPMAIKMGMNWSLCEYSTSNRCLHYLIGACDKRDDEWSHCIRTKIKHIYDLHAMDDVFHICNKKIEHQLLSDVDMKRKNTWHQCRYTASRGFVKRYGI